VTVAPDLDPAPLFLSVLFILLTPMLPNACAAACKLAARAQVASRVLNPPPFALRRISARSIGSAFDRPSTLAFGLRRALSTQASLKTTQSPLVASAAPQLKNLARKFFSSNASLSAPRFFASNATLVADGATAGEEAAAPAIAPRSVGWWLLASAGLIYAVVVVGGLTRLTESGLSITEWKPITGILPPLSTEAWEEEFAKYKNSPEFTKYAATEFPYPVGFFANLLFDSDSTVV